MNVSSNDLILLLLLFTFLCVAVIHGGNEGQSKAMERRGVMVMGGQRRELWDLQNVIQWMLSGL